MDFVPHVTEYVSTLPKSQRSYAVEAFECTLDFQFPKDGEWRLVRVLGASLV